MKHVIICRTTETDLWVQSLSYFARKDGCKQHIVECLDCNVFFDDLFLFSIVEHIYWICTCIRTILEQTDMKLEHSTWFVTWLVTVIWPDLWPDLTWFVTFHFADIEKHNLLPPLLVIQTLSRDSTCTLEVVKVTVINFIYFSFTLCVS